MERKILYRFFEGKASLEEEEEVCDWTEASEENMQEYIKERKYFDLLLVQNKRNSTPHSSGKGYLLNNLIKYAAVVLLLIMCGLQVYYITKPEKNFEMNTIIVPTGQRVNLLLSDGTNVWLNSGSKMRYPASFTKDKREVTLDGEGYFEAYNDTPLFSAALMEGSIQISDKTEPSNITLLHPQQKANSINGQLVVEKIQNYDIYRWRDGLLCFEHIAFNDLMKEFEKTYDIQIINENKNLDNYICSGKFRISDGVDFILQVLQRDVKFRFQRNENNTIIYIK